MVLICVDLEDLWLKLCLPGRDDVVARQSGPSRESGRANHTPQLKMHVMDSEKVGIAWNFGSI